jgi:enamine deaminase RidA (YjgF/YER057c/UK114 family)
MRIRYTQTTNSEKQIVGNRIPACVVLMGIMLAMAELGNAQEKIRYFEPNSSTGASTAVAVGDVPLVHTGQLFPPDDNRQPSDVSSQTQQLLDQLSKVLGDAEGNRNQIVKLNIYVTQAESVPAVQAVLARRFPQTALPAVSFVVTRLPHAGKFVALDAIAVANPDASRAKPPSGPRLTAVLGTGSRIYVAGQAEKGANLVEATRLTLESLQRTLQHLGRTNADIVQLKSFLSPMADMSQAQQAMAAFFGDQPIPPTVWVEWQSPLIEIELVAWGGEKRNGPAIEFLTPPGMTASPVYSRVVRTNSEQLIYVSGLYSRKTTDAAGEVMDIMDQLGGALRQTGSDLRHLVKATYYCSNSETSTKLNELRPKFYDPTRPPSASKALVTDVGRPERGLTIDMIAIPSAN